MVRRKVLTPEAAMKLPAVLEELIVRAFTCGYVTAKNNNARLEPRTPETDEDLELNGRMMQLLNDNGVVYGEETTGEEAAGQSRP